MEYNETKTESLLRLKLDLNSYGFSPTYALVVSIYFIVDVVVGVVFVVVFSAIVVVFNVVVVVVVCVSIDVFFVLVVVVVVVVLVRFHGKIVFPCKRTRQVKNKSKRSILSI